ncbi:MAG: hypothetical protein GC129_04125 [Proteobacteria bacterium]|nr:hypothetical protein [Pseudomonadota bacterium]
MARKPSRKPQKRPGEWRFTVLRDKILPLVIPTIEAYGRPMTANELAEVLAIQHPNLLKDEELLRAFRMNLSNLCKGEPKSRRKRRTRRPPPVLVHLKGFGYWPVKLKRFSNRKLKNSKPWNCGKLTPQIIGAETRLALHLNGGEMQMTSLWRRLQKRGLDIPLRHIRGTTSRALTLPEWLSDPEFRIDTRKNLVALTAPTRSLYAA